MVSKSMKFYFYLFIRKVGAVEHQHNNINQEKPMEN